MKTALIFGIIGQDGYYLTKLLLEKDYKITGVVRRHSQPSLGSLMYLQPSDLAKITIVYGDVTDTSIIYQLVAEKPDEIYNLAAQSHVKISWDNPNVTYEINTGGTLKILNAMYLAAPKSRLYFAGSSEQFGNSKDEKQNEDTPFNPQSPYAISKVAAFNYVKNYRESYGLYACSGICFNHESPLRGLEFVTRKISYHVAMIKKGYTKELHLGNIDSKRDWGYAGDCVEAMWLMLQQNEAKDYVVGTGETHSIKEFLEIAFNHVGLNWQDYVVIDNAFKRPVDINSLCADASKIKKELGWEASVKFKELVKLMVDSDMEKVK